MNGVKMIGSILYSGIARVFNTLGLFFSVIILRVVSKHRTVGVVVEYTTQDVRYRNGHIVDYTVPEYHYEVRFHGKKRDELRVALEKWYQERKGVYAFSKSTKTNEGAEVPENFSCMCSASDAFMRKMSFKKIPVANKFHIYIR